MEVQHNPFNQQIIIQKDGSLSSLNTTNTARNGAGGERRERERERRGERGGGRGGGLRNIVTEENMPVLLFLSFCLIVVLLRSFGLDISIF